MLIIVSVLVLACKTGISQVRTRSSPYEILVVMNNTQEPYRDALEGFRESLDTNGINYVITTVDPGARTDLRNLIRSSNGRDPDLILAVGTYKSNLTISTINDIPVIFCMTLDTNKDTPAWRNNRNATGVFLNVPVRTQFRTLRQAFPELRSLGVIYSPGGNDTLIRNAEIAANSLNLQLEKADVRNEREALRTVNNLIRVVDALWMIVDSPFSSNSKKRVVRDSYGNNVAIMGVVETQVQLNLATFAISTEYKDNGKQSGDIAVRLLRGTPPSRLPYEYPKVITVFVHERSAQNIGLKIPDDPNLKIRIIK